MSREPEELTLRASLRRRRPITLPEGFADRLDKIPDEVRPLSPLPVRLALAVLPWVAVAAAGLILAFAPIGTAPSSLVGTPSDVPWDPAAPNGGLAEVGPFGLPWVPAMPFVALAGGIWAVRRVRSGRSIVPRPRINLEIPQLEILQPVKLRLPRRRAPSTRRGRIGTVIWLGCLLGLNVFIGLIRDWDPLMPGTASGPGPGVTEVRRDGSWYDLSEDDVFARFRTDGPNYVYRIGPTQAFTYFVTVLNAGPVTLTLLGRDPAGDATTAANGLGLLRDPSFVSADPKDVVAFHPVVLSPGQEVTLVVADIGARCADPAADLPVDPPNVQSPNVMGFVYEVVGWRRVGDVNQPFEVTVPSTPGCV